MQPVQSGDQRVSMKYLIRVLLCASVDSAMVRDYSRAIVQRPALLTSLLIAHWPYCNLLGSTTDVSHGNFEIDAKGFGACGADHWLGDRLNWVGREERCRRGNLLRTMLYQLR